MLIYRIYIQLNYIISQQELNRLTHTLNECDQSIQIVQYVATRQHKGCTSWIEHNHQIWASRRWLWLMRCSVAAHRDRVTLDHRTRDWLPSKPDLRCYLVRGMSYVLEVAYEKVIMFLLINSKIYLSNK